MNIMPEYDSCKLVQRPDHILISDLESNQFPAKYQHFVI